MSVLRVPVCKCVYVCVFADISESRSLTSVCFSVSVWVCTPVLVYECVRACMHVVVLVSSFDCLHLSSQLLLLTFLAPFRPPFPPSIPRCLPLHVAPSPLGVDTETPKTVLLTPHCCDHFVQTLGVTRCYLSTLETHPSLHHFIICNKIYYIIIQSWALLQDWLPFESTSNITKVWKEDV